MIDEVFAFPDTNVFLHYKPLAQIDWCRLLSASSVTLVICLPVIQELDGKKSDARLADRARRAIKEIEEHYNGARPLRLGVSLDIFNEELRRDEFPASLSPDSQDDRIVHLVRKYAETHPGRATRVLTEDLGMALRCRVGGVTCHRMEESDRLENPGDEKDRKLKQVQAELASLKSRLPKLSINIIPPGPPPEGHEPFHCTLTDDWSDFDSLAEVEKQRKAHPKHADRTPSRFGIQAARFLEDHISQDKWDRYDRELDNYLANYELYIDRLNTWGSNKARTIRFSVLFQNTGTSPATDIDIFLAFPTKIRWLAQQGEREADTLKRPDPPTPPQRPSPEFVSALSSLRGFGGPLTSMIPGLRDIAPRPDLDEPEVRVVLRPEQGHLIHAKLRKQKHGEGIILGTFLAVIGAWSDVSPFEVEYSISTSEHPDRISGKLPLIISKAQKVEGANAGDDAGGSSGS